MSILNQNLLTLDFWQDKVTYGKRIVPTGSIGCAALNITDEQIGTLTTLCQPLTEIILMLGTGNVDVSVFPKAEESLLQIIRFLQNTEPFSFLDLATDEKELHRLFDEEHIENILAYIKAAQEIGAAASLDERYTRGVGVMKLIQVMAHQISSQKTTVFVSHRLASTSFCDRILLIENGRICEEGNHNELLKQNGKYSMLFEMQAKYYRDNLAETEVAE